MTTEFTKNIELIQKLKSVYIAAGGAHAANFDKYLGAVSGFLHGTPVPEAKMHIEGLMKAAFTDGYLSASLNHPENVHPLDLSAAWVQFKDLFATGQPEEPEFCQCGKFNPCGDMCATDAGQMEVVAAADNFFADGIKGLMVELEEIKRLVIKDRVDITGQDYKIEVKLGDEHIREADRQTKLKRFLESAARDGLIVADKTSVLNLIDDLYQLAPTNKDISGLFAEFEKIEVAPEVKAEPINERCWDRCALRGCASKKKCQNPKNCDGRFPERNPMTPVAKIHGMIMRHKSTGNVLDMVHEQFAKWTFTSGEEAYKWLWSITMQNGYDYSLLVSDDDCIWRNYDENRDEPHEEIWRVAVAPRYNDIARKLTETERQFLHRAIKEISEIRHRERLPMHETAGAFSHFRTAEEHLITIALDTFNVLNKKAADIAKNTEEYCKRTQR